jgi:hypothetical protein
MLNIWISRQLQIPYCSTAQNYVRSLGMSLSTLLLLLRLFTKLFEILLFHHMYYRSGSGNKFIFHKQKLSVSKLWWNNNYLFFLHGKVTKNGNILHKFEIFIFEKFCEIWYCRIYTYRCRENITWFILGPLERAKPDKWLRLALSEGPNRVGSSLPPPEGENRSSFRNVLLSRTSLIL